MLVQNDNLPKEPPCLRDMILKECRSHSKSQWGLSHTGELQAVHRNCPGSEGTSHSSAKLPHIITINRSLKKTNKQTTNQRTDQLLYYLSCSHPIISIKKN